MSGRDTAGDADRPGADRTLPSAPQRHERDVSRRDVVAMLGALPLAIGIEGGPEVIRRATEAAEAAMAAARDGQAFQPAFFTDHELRTVRALVDLIIPADDRSGSATEAGVPEFMDFMMVDRPGGQSWMRDGLAWMDAEARRRGATDFVSATAAQRTSVLDDIAWPERASDAMQEGVRFFNRFRDLTSSGFWSSRMGVADLQYIGNTFVQRWEGCPEPALRKLGVSYERDWEGR